MVSDKSAPAQSRFDLAEPAERADPVADLLNAMLDQIGDSVRRLIAEGHESQVRARLAQWLPPPAVPEPNTSKKAATRIALSDIDRAIRLSNLHRYLAARAKAAAIDTSRKEAETHADFVAAELAALREKTP